MLDLTIHEGVYFFILIAFTTTAAVFDMRFQRIPNYLTVPFFAAGLVYQLVFHGFAGLGDSLVAFAAGFGSLLGLWLIGGGGGGDVKLVGALSVWLGLKYTLVVLLASVFFAIVVSVVGLMYQVTQRGVSATKERYLRVGNVSSGRKRSKAELERMKRRRRLVAFAVPVALSTWLVIVLDAVGVFTNKFPQ